MFVRSWGCARKGVVVRIVDALHNDHQMFVHKKTAAAAAVDDEAFQRVYSWMGWGGKLTALRAGRFSVHFTSLYLIGVHKILFTGSGQIFILLDSEEVWGVEGEIVMGDN